MIGVVYPFQISNGVVATTNDPSTIARSQISFCMGTQVLERVMRPTWGVELANAAHALGADAHEVVTEAIADAFQQWFPGLVLQKVKTQFKDTTLFVEIIYGRQVGEAGDKSDKVGVAIPGGAEIFSSEVPF